MDLSDYVEDAFSVEGDLLLTGYVGMGDDSHYENRKLSRLQHGPGDLIFMTNWEHCKDIFRERRMIHRFAIPVHELGSPSPAFFSMRLSSWGAVRPAMSKWFGAFRPNITLFLTDPDDYARIRLGWGH